MARAAESGPLTSRTVTEPVYRIVASRYPTVSLFETLRSETELLMLAELESLTNTRWRQEMGEINLVRPGDAVTGPGYTPVMAAFCHPSSSRFTDGSFGIYYAALSTNTAIAETRHHAERFLREANIAHEVQEKRCYSASLLQKMTDLPAGRAAALLDPDSWTASQAFGAAMRATDAWGLFYPSVRDQPDGLCVAVLRPPALSATTQVAHYRYIWDGSRIAQIEQYTVYDAT